MEEFPERRRERQLAFPQAPSSSSSSEAAVEKEHMFDKVVTPSDVGKLNRLVIPKQHAEKHFPLDPACGDKGLSLCFEDRAGKQWRFRYSYWTSSQSYVMTKGWSRFVKEKRLDAGDTVSFQRGLGELARHRLFIDWRRRPEPPIPHAPAIMSFAPWAGFVDADPRRQHLGFPPEALWYLRSTAAPAQIPVQLGGPLVLSSVTVIPSAAAAKRVRLFGVNLADSEASAGDPAERLRLSLGLSSAADSPPADHPAMSLELKM